MLWHFGRFHTSLFVTRGDQHSYCKTSNTPSSWVSQHPFIHPYDSHILCPEQQSLLIPWRTRQRASLIPMSFVITGLGHLQTSSVWQGVWRHLRLGCQSVLYIVLSTPWSCLTNSTLQPRNKTKKTGQLWLRWWHSRGQGWWDWGMYFLFLLPDQI